MRETPEMGVFQQPANSLAQGFRLSKDENEAFRKADIAANKRQR
jgi:hypothetical protein